MTAMVKQKFPNVMQKITSFNQDIQSNASSGNTDTPSRGETRIKQPRSQQVQQSSQLLSPADSSLKTTLG